MSYNMIAKKISVLYEAKIIEEISTMLLGQVLHQKLVAYHKSESFHKILHVAPRKQILLHSLE